MKGVLLAGGTGTRLRPVTAVTNKHLLPVYDRPMIHWPLEVFRANGVREVMVVTGREHAGAVFGLLGSGADLGFDFTFRVQDRAGGIAEAIALAEAFVGPFVSMDRIVDGDDFLVVLGDNVFIPPPEVPPLPSWAGAGVWLARVPYPEFYGVPVFGEGGRVRAIMEKPQHVGPLDMAVVGLYHYRADAFDVIRGLRPSARGELEVSDLNNAYAARGELAHAELGGRWWDAGGSLELLARAGEEVRAALAGERRAEVRPVAEEGLPKWA